MLHFVAAGVIFEAAKPQPAHTSDWLHQIHQSGFISIYGKEYFRLQKSAGLPEIAKGIGEAKTLCFLTLEGIIADVLSIS